jgi:AcrR family transcriptional regulator
LRSRRERKKQQTRDLLERTARRLFAERGFEQVSIAEIARAADVSEATVFNYFPTKDDLVYGGMQTFQDALLWAIRERPAGEPVLAAFSRFVLELGSLLAAAEAGAVEELGRVSRLIASSPALLTREAELARDVRSFGESAFALLAGGLGGYAPKPPSATGHR